MLRRSGKFRLVECKSAAELRVALETAGGAVVLFAANLSEDAAALAGRVREAGAVGVVVLAAAEVMPPALLPMVAGVVTRSVAAEDLVACVKTVAAGGRWVPAEKMKAVASRPKDAAGERVLRSLTPKELQIVALVAAGGKNREIATKLKTTEQVIKNYLRAIYDKTGVSDRLELSLYTVHHAAIAEAIAGLNG